MTSSRLEQRLGKYALTPFSGSSGPRRDLIVEDLTNAGLSPKVDGKGNVLIVKPSVKDNEAASLLVSSHMDTVFGLDASKYIFGKSGDGNFVGTLDNAVGCAINVELAINSQPSVPTYFVFTVNEEKGGGGADEVLKQVKEEDPICITLDVTPDDFNHPFNIENVRPDLLSPKLNSVVSELAGERIPIIPTTVFDESCVYGRHATAFSVCPVVHGGVHSETSAIEGESIKAAYDFLLALLQKDGLPETLGHIQNPANEVWELLRVARGKAHNAGHHQSNFMYSVEYANLDAYVTYCFLPATLDPELLSKDGKQSEFIQKIKNNAYPACVRDELEICLASLEVGVKLDDRKKRNPTLVYSYEISLYYPYDHKEIIKEISDAYEGKAKSQRDSRQHLVLKFDGGEHLSQQVPNIFVSLLNDYNERFVEHTQ